MVRQPWSEADLSTESPSLPSVRGPGERWSPLRVKRDGVIFEKAAKFESFNQHSALTAGVLLSIATAAMPCSLWYPGNSISMTDIDSIHDALSIFTIFFQTPIEPFDASASYSATYPFLCSGSHHQPLASARSR